MNMPLSKIVEDILKIKELCQRILEKIDAGQFEGSKKELEALLALDVDEAQHLEKDVEDEELIQHTRAVLQAAREATQSIEGHKQSSIARELIQKILLLENYDLTKIINFKKFEEQALQHLLLLLEKQTVSVEERDGYLAKIRGKVSPKVYKQIEKKLKAKTQVQKKSYEPGPIYKQKELVRMGESIQSFFASPDAQEFPSGNKIKFYLFGSLITGFSNNDRSPNYGLPSDMGRVSDVDLLIVVTPEIWKIVTSSMDRKQIVTIKGTQRTMPVGFHTHPGVESTGPFKNLFYYLNNLSFAGRVGRPISVFFMMDTWLLTLNLREKPHLHIMDITTK
jgi:hypothetical protein